MQIISRGILGLVLTLFGTLASIPAAHAVTVDLGGGRLVQGRSEGGTDIFEGIPYGKVAERFMPPAPASWSGLLDATEKAKSCWHVDFAVPFPNNVRPRSETTEDCLTVNVLRPATCNGGCDVLVWLAPGAWRADEPMGYVYPDSNRGRGFPFAEAYPKTIVVTVSRRVDVTGFAYHKVFEDRYRNEYGLSEWEPPGLLDERLALEWVSANIGAFGGNGSKITLIGQSAGGWSVLYHAARPASNHLVKRFVAMGSNGDDPRLYRPKAEKAALDAKLFADLGCEYNGDAAAFTACVNALTIDEMSPTIASLLATDFFRWGTILDDQGRTTNDRLADPALVNKNAEYLIFEQRNEALSQVLQPMIPLLLASDSSALAFYTESATPAQAADVLATDVLLGGDLSAAREIVDAVWDPDQTPFQNLLDAFSHIYFNCSARSAAEALAVSTQPGRLYRMEWNYRCEGYDGMGPTLAEFTIPADPNDPNSAPPSYISGHKCTHSTSETYLFRHLKDPALPADMYNSYHPQPWNGNDPAASEAIGNLITSFAHTGKPKASDDVQLKSYDWGPGKLTYLFDIAFEPDGRLKPFAYESDRRGLSCGVVDSVLGF